MSDAYTHFGLLLADVWDGSKATMILRPAAGGEGGAALQLGADAAGNRHILAPIAADYAFTPEKGRSIELGEWVHPQTGQRHLDLRCDADQLAKPFCALADHIIERIDQDGELPHSALQTALSEWHMLLSPARQLSEEAARGLFGELFTLGLLADINPLFAVEQWTGPLGELHDYRTPNGDIEVKTTAQEGQSVSISSLDQLDRVAGVPLVLLRIQVESTPSGKNIADMVAELVGKGCLQITIVERLEAAGFKLGLDPDKHRFVVTAKPAAWQVGDDFPGLRSADIPEGRRSAISRINYSLDLVGASGLMTDDELQSYMSGMMSA